MIVIRAPWWVDDSIRIVGMVVVVNSFYLIPILVSMPGTPWWQAILGPLIFIDIVFRWIQATTKSDEFMKSELKSASQ